MLPWQHRSSLRQQLLQQATRHPGSLAWEGRACWLLQRRRAVTRNVSPTRESVTQNVLEACLPMTGCCSAACRSLPGSAHTSTHAPTPSLKEGLHGAPGAAEKNEPGRNRLAFRISLHQDPKALLPPTPCGYL